ncbi:MAG: hypothetical protein ACP5T9_06215 [Thermoplasmata archaeon]
MTSSEALLRSNSDKATKYIYEKNNRIDGMKSKMGIMEKISVYHKRNAIKESLYYTGNVKVTVQGGKYDILRKPGIIKILFYSFLILTGLYFLFSGKSMILEILSLFFIFFTSIVFISTKNEDKIMAGIFGFISFIILVIAMVLGGILIAGIMINLSGQYGMFKMESNRVGSFLEFMMIILILFSVIIYEAFFTYNSISFMRLVIRTIYRNYLISKIIFFGFIIFILYLTYEYPWMYSQIISETGKIFFRIVRST